MLDKHNALTPAIQEKAKAYAKEWGDKLPTLAQWRSASSVFLATRGSDNILTNIDQFVFVIEQDSSGDRRVALSFLYFMTDHWLKLAGVGTGAKLQTHLEAQDINTSRLAAIYALFTVTVNTLCSELTAGDSAAATASRRIRSPSFSSACSGATS